MRIDKSYKYRLYPNATQENLLNKVFGCCRFVWNNYVEVFRSYDKVINPNPEYKTVKQLRDEYPFLKEVSSSALGYKVRHFNQFKKMFFKTRADAGDYGKPKFQNKRANNSFTIQYGNPQHRFKVSPERGRIRIEKIGWVKYVCDRELPGDAVIKNLTVSRNACGHYYASIQFECNANSLPKTGKNIGIDLGLKSYITTSEGVHIDNPRYFAESQSEIARLQMWQSKKRGNKKGETKSRRWLKLQRRINRKYEHLKNQRKDFLHNLTTDIIHNYDTICLEDLNVSGMMKNNKLAKSIGDASWGMFYSFLQYKAVWYGRELVYIDRYYPSSKTCSHCGCKKDNLSLRDRVFVCPVCGLKINRDLNAAINIQRVGVEALYNRSQSGHKPTLGEQSALKRLSSIKEFL